MNLDGWPVGPNNRSMCETLLRLVVGRMSHEATRRWPWSVQPAEDWPMVFSGVATTGAGEGFQWR
jgi:hypothetical protein